VPKPLSAFDLKQLARIGAAARIKELEREIALLRRAFPNLSPAATPAPDGPDANPLKAGQKATATRRGRRSPMSAAERRAVSLRMQKYWAERRKSKDKP
jgi:hypothetical protein